jgi:hypothetical protein
MKTEDAIKIVLKKASYPAYLPYLILVFATLFLLRAITELYFIVKIIGLLDFLTWSKIISIAIQIEPAKKYLGVELQAVVWLKNSILYFTVASFFYLSFYIIKKDILICKALSGYLKKQKDN